MEICRQGYSCDPNFVTTAVARITVKDNDKRWAYSFSLSREVVFVGSLSRVVVTGVRPTVMESGPNTLLSTARSHDRWHKSICSTVSRRSFVICWPEIEIQILTAVLDSAACQIVSDTVTSPISVFWPSFLKKYKAFREPFLCLCFFEWPWIWPRKFCTAAALTLQVTIVMAGAGDAPPHPDVNYAPKISESPALTDKLFIVLQSSLAHSLYNRALGEGSVSIHVHDSF